MEDKLYQQFKQSQASTEKRAVLVHKIGDESVELMMEAMSDEEFRKMPMIAKMKFLANQQAIIPGKIKGGFAFATFLFFFISISALFCTLNYTVKDLFPEATDDKIYYLKVATCFVFYNAVANWICTVCYESFFEESEDRPNAEGTLWNKASASSNRKIASNVIKDRGVRGASTYMVGYEPDEHTGLQWRRCVVCKLDAPPRCHHCAICQRCVLKRDHHCYMTGVCIGFRNQRFFTILCFYVSVGALVGGYGHYNYLRNHAGQFLYSRLDLLLPFTVYRAVFGSLPWHMVWMILQLYVFAFVSPMTVAFSLFQWASVITGKTVHEVRKSEDIIVKLSFADRFAEVFGRMWFLNFLFPAQLVFRQEGDGVTWRGTFDRRVLRRLRAEKTRSSGAGGEEVPCVIKVAHVA